MVQIVGIVAFDGATGRTLAQAIEISVQQRDSYDAEREQQARRERREAARQARRERLRLWELERLRQRAWMVVKSFKRKRQKRPKDRCMSALARQLEPLDLAISIVMEKAAAAWVPPENFQADQDFGHQVPFS